MPHFCTFSYSLSIIRAMQYVGEFMTAIIVASTALMGLCGLFLAYIGREKEMRKDKGNERLGRSLLTWSIFFGPAAIMVSLVFFLSELSWLMLVAWIIFSFQLITFFLAMMFMKLFQV